MKLLSQNVYLLVASYLNPVWWLIKKNTKSILDVGCGDGKNGILLYMRMRKLSLTGVDIYQKYLDIARARNCYEKLEKADVGKISYPSKSFDCVSCLQVIEHLNKKDAIELVKRIVRIEVSIL